MNIGHEIVSTVLTEGKLLPLLDSGFNYNFLNGAGTGSNVIFTGTDKQAYQWLLSHWKRHKKVPALSIFREHFPEKAYPLSSAAHSLDELIELAASKVQSYLVADLIGKTIDLHDEGDIDQAVALLKAESSRIGTDIKFRKARADSLNDGSFDIEEMLNRTVEMGIPFGLEPIDEDFWGIQAGQLVTLLGRQKAGKTTFTLNSALNAWLEGYTVLFFSVEMDVDMLRQKLYAMGAHVSPSRFRRGRLRDSEKERVRAFYNEMTSDDDVGFHISKKKALITVDDVREEIRLYNPNIVYIDGFDFMVDRHTGRMTRDWQANEFVANELKTIALEEQVAVFINTQVQEKQYSPKYGIEARTMAGGTGPLKASDLVIGLDKTDGQHTLNCVLTRYEYFDDVIAEVDWETMKISILESGPRALEGKGI